MPGPFKEGPVEISFEPSAGKQKVTVTIDFGKMKISAGSAALVMTDMVRFLREKLGVKLPIFKE